MNPDAATADVLRHAQLRADATERERTNERKSEERIFTHNQVQVGTDATKNSGIAREPILITRRESAFKAGSHFSLITIRAHFGAQKEPRASENTGFR